MTNTKNHNIYKPLLHFFAGGFLLLMTTVVLKLAFVFFHSDLFDLRLEDILHALFLGLQFDLSLVGSFLFVILVVAVVGYFLQPAWLDKLARSLFFLAILVIIGIQTADIIYFDSAGRHLSYELKQGATDFFGLAYTALRVYPALVIFALVLAVVAFLLLAKLPTIARQMQQGKLATLAVVLALLIFCVFLIRGQFVSIKLTPGDVHKIGTQAQALIATNGTYHALHRSFFQKNTAHFLINQDAEDNNTTIDFNALRALYTNVTQDAQAKTPTNTHTPPETIPNIVVIMLESWGSFLVDAQTTPFFYYWQQRAFSVDGIVSGGLRTTEGLFSLFCSAQNPLGGSIVGRLLDNHYNCLPHILQQYNFNTMLLQGTNKNTSGMAALAHKIGFQRTFGKHEIPASSSHEWGLYDDAVYDFALQQAKQQKTPFLLAINTNTTHLAHVPEEIEAPFGRRDARQSHRSLMHLADKSLARFFVKYAALDLNPTLFLLVADHSLRRISPNMSSNIRHFVLPFLMDCVGCKKQYRLRKKGVYTQRDIAPTLLQWLGMPSEKQFSGSTMLGQEAAIADYYINGILGWVVNDRLIEIALQKTNRPMTCYTLDTRPWRVAHRLCDALDDTHKQQALSFSYYTQRLLATGKLALFKDFAL